MLVVATTVLIIDFDLINISMIIVVIWTKCEGCDFCIVPLVNLVDISKMSGDIYICLLYTSPSPRDATLSRMPSSA
mgnify:CR=1 FL=1